MKKIFVLLLLVFAGLRLIKVDAQVAISSTATIPDPSAMLDVKSNTKGMLIPRTSTSSRTAIINPAKGLLVYDTSASSFWFHNGISWNEITTSNTGWTLSGNAGTNPATNFIGTPDNQPLIFKVHSLPSGKLDEGNANSFWGINAGGLSIGKQNTAMGYFALRSNTLGANNVAIGNKALFGYGGSFNTAVGDSALANANNTLGDTYNTALGARALTSNTSGEFNTATGANALFLNAGGAFNTGTGYGALFSNISGGSNTASGYKALFFNSASNNTATGAFALQANMTGNNNTAMGNAALFTNNTGSFNTAVGSGALNKSSIGSANTALGAGALNANTIGFDNIAIGVNALFSSPDQFNNIAVGDSALLSNTSGFANLGVGSSAMIMNTTGNNNTALGMNALELSTSGSRNTAIGGSSLFHNDSGGENVAIGLGALFLNVSGNNNTGIGSGANIQFTNLKYATAIGSDAIVACSNCMVLGGDDATARTKVGINISAPATDLHIIQQSNADLNDSRGIELQQGGGSGNQWRTFIDPSNNYIFQYDNGLFGYIDPVGASFHNFSDARLKKDIQPLENVLDKVLQLRAMTYHYKTNNESDPRLYGFVAQDVEKIFPEFVSTAENGFKGVAYSNFAVVAIQAIQEQQIQIDEQKKDYEELKNMMQWQMMMTEELKKEIELLKKENRVAGK